MTVVATLSKNSREELRIELAEFNGHRLINSRVWVEPREGGGDKIPTKSGLALRIEQLPDLIASLQQAEAQARRDGWL